MKKIISVSLFLILLLNSCMISKKNHLNEVAKKDTEIQNTQKENTTLKFQNNVYINEIKQLESKLDKATEELKLKNEFILSKDNKITEINNKKLEKNFVVKKLNTTSDSLSYFIGNDLIQNLYRNGLDVTITESSFLQGMRDASLEEDKLLLSPKKGREIAQRIMINAQAKKAKSEKGGFKEKIEAGEKFLTKKSAEKGVITLPSGLRYKIMTKGTGSIPNKKDKIKAHYHGTLVDGTVFDSSVERGKPFTANVTQVIPGWVEALQLMPVGSKWELYVPYKMAYGERGSGQEIGPYETLIFQVELLEILEK